MLAVRNGQHQTQISHWIHIYPYLSILTGQITALIAYTGSSRWAMLFIVVLIAIKYSLAFQASLTTVIVFGLL